MYIFFFLKKIKMSKRDCSERKIRTFDELSICLAFICNQSLKHILIAFWNTCPTSDFFLYVFMFLFDEKIKIISFICKFKNWFIRKRIHIDSIERHLLQGATLVEEKFLMDYGTACGLTICHSPLEAFRIYCEC